MSPLSLLLGWSVFYGLSVPVTAAIGDVNCRYHSTTPAVVNYYICSQFADYYEISVDQFFELNPTLNPTCDNVQPDTDYCVAGFIETQLVSTDGFCGPRYNNATCAGTDKQCCNSETWQCGDTTEDCQAGTCYEGDCMVDSPTVYSLDGTCGPANGDKICAGKWGNCCSYNGWCGNGTDYCAQSNCQNGACEQAPMPESGESMTDIFGTTPDGSCGGSTGYTCGVLYGNCCGKDNKCGSTLSECGIGCQSKFGSCTGSTTTQPAQPSATSNVSPDGSCGGAGGYTCEGYSAGSCCSSAGYCGGTPDFCDAGCQSAFGLCKDTRYSADGTCGGADGYSCKNSPFGHCCSAAGYCGSTAAFCAGACQPGYGVCQSPSVTRDGTCGGSKKLKCPGSGFGDCCSASGNCGSTADYCEAGCQSAFGKCTAGGAPILVWDPATGTYVEPTTPEPTSTASSDGTCGSGNRDLTCTGGAFDGQCCSQLGWCGITTAHCDSGCQQGYGKCN